MSAEITTADDNNTVKLTVILYSTIRLLDTVITNYDDNDYISVFDFNEVKKKSKKSLVIMVHGIYLLILSTKLICFLVETAIFVMISTIRVDGSSCSHCLYP